MMLRFCAVFNELEKPFAWVSLQPKGDISVGLVDRAFVSPASLREGDFNRTTLEYLVAHSPAALTQVKNPHFTFHPPFTYI